MRLREFIFEGDKWWDNDSVKSPTPDPRYSPSAPAQEGLYFIMFNGKPFKPKGKLAVYKSAEAATKIADSLTATYNKTTQVELLPK